MNDKIAADLVQSKFAIAVRNFTPKMSQKFQMLMPFKAGIAELRGKGASYNLIVDILFNSNVSVSHDTMRRFCREVLGLKPRRRRQRKGHHRRPTQSSRTQPPTNSVHEYATKGPRIADPNEI